MFRTSLTWLGGQIQHTNTLLKRGYTLTQPTTGDFKFIMQKVDSIVYIATFERKAAIGSNLEERLCEYINHYSTKNNRPLFISPSTDRYQYHLENISQHSDLEKINADLFYSIVKE